MNYQSSQIYIERKDSNTQAYITFFSFLTAVCVPFATVDIAGFGVLLLFTIPLFVLVVIPKIRSGKIIVTKPGLLLLLFISYSIFACIWSPSFSSTYLYQYLKTALLILCLYANKYSLKEQRTLIIGSSISCFLICLFMLTGSSTIAYVEGRATISVFGASQDPNYIAYAFFFAFTISLDGMFENRGILKKTLCLVSMLIILYCILLTGSRGSWVSIAAIVSIYSLSKYGRSWKTILLVGVLIVGIIYIYPLIIQLLPPDLARRFTLEHLMHNNGSNRLDIWVRTLEVLKSSPAKLIVGYGTGSSVAIVGRATHNYFLQLLLEEGIIGLLLFVFFSCYWVKALIRSKSTISLCVFVACIVMAFTLSVNTSYYFWVTLLLCILCRDIDWENKFWQKTSVQRGNLA